MAGLQLLLTSAPNLGCAPGLEIFPQPRFPWQLGMGGGYGMSFPGCSLQQGTKGASGLKKIGSQIWPAL